MRLLFCLFAAVYAVPTKVPSDDVLASSSWNRGHDPSWKPVPTIGADSYEDRLRREHALFSFDHKQVQDKIAAVHERLYTNVDKLLSDLEKSKEDDKEQIEQLSALLEKYFDDSKVLTDLLMSQPVDKAAVYAKLDELEANGDYINRHYQELNRYNIKNKIEKIWFEAYREVRELEENEPRTLRPVFEAAEKLNKVKGEAYGKKVKEAVDAYDEDTKYRDLIELAGLYMDEIAMWKQQVEEIFNPKTEEQLIEADQQVEIPTGEETVENPVPVDGADEDTEDDEDNDEEEDPEEEPAVDEEKKETREINQETEKKPTEKDAPKERTWSSWFSSFLG